VLLFVIPERHACNMLQQWSEYVHNGFQVTEKVSKIGFIAGTIQRDKLNAFERLLFRATRGNLFLRSSEIEEIRDPASGEMQKKNVFVVFFAGERSRQKASKVTLGINLLVHAVVHRGLQQKSGTILM